MDFRGCSAAAPLKQTLRPRTSELLQHFRGCSAAAPLKRPEGWPSRAYRKKFPRLFSRGSIEAARCRWTSWRSAAFPRLFSRGSIEASRFSRAICSMLQFPRLFSRGSIEACRNGHQAVS